MQKNILISMFCLGFFLSSYAQLKTYSMEEVESLNTKSPKPILVFIHTDWCKYCKLMENTTLKEQKVIEELNNLFYFVSLNAENKEKITYNQHTFVYKPTGASTGHHELATELATINGQITYPTITILDPKNEIVYQKNSYLKADAFLKVINKTIDLISH